MHLSLVTIVTVSAVIFHQVSATTRSLRIASTARIASAYVNGAPLTGVTFSGRWWAPTTFTVPSTSGFLAVKFISSTRPDAFILSDGITGCSIFSSQATVRCVTPSSVSRVTNSWYLNTFIDSMWPIASVSSVAYKVLVYPTRQFCQQANWMWTATPASVIYCRIRITPVVICPTLNVPNSVLNTTAVSLTTPVRVSCNNGYAFNPRNALNNSIVTVCTGSGRWSPLPSLCQQILCPPLNLPNATLNTTNVSYSTAVRVSCSDGYANDPLNAQLRDYGVETVCTSNGTWLPFTYSCPRARLAVISESWVVGVLAIAHLNDQFFVSRGQVPHVSVYNATSFQLLREITFTGLGNTVWGLAACAINNYLYISDKANNMIHRVDLPVTSPTPAVTSFSVPGSPNALSVNAAGNVLVSLDDGGIREYNSSGALVRTFAINAPIMQALELNDGKWLISTLDDDLKLSKINDVGVVTDTFTTLTYDFPANMAIDTRGYILFTAIGNNAVMVVNPSLTNGREIIPFPDIPDLNKPLGLSFDRSRNRVYIGERRDRCPCRVLVVLDGAALFNL